MWCLAVLAGSGCSEPRQTGLELTLQDGPTETAEYHRVPVLLGARRSQYGANGLYMEARLRRGTGAVAEIMIDVPYAGSGGAMAKPRASYVERLGGQVVFTSSRVAGRIELSRDGACPCQTGRLELRFTAEGPDGQYGTADDSTRQISRGRLRRDGRPFCHAAEALPIREDVLVLGARVCPAAGHARSGGGVAVWGWSDDGWYETDGWNDDGWYDEDWSGEWSEGWSDDDPGADPAVWEEGWTDPDAADDWGDESGGGTGSGDSTDDAYDSYGDSGWDTGDDSWSDDGWSDDGSDSGSDDSWTDWGWDDGGSDEDDW